MPLSHPPGHAQCDFGEALVVIGGVERKAHCFVIDLPHSDGCFVKAYPAETTEAFLDGHVSAFAYLGSVPQSILYDNTKLAVAVLGYWGMASASAPAPSPSCSLTTCSRTGSAAPARAMTKARWRAWWGTCAATFWCPYRPSRASMRSMHTWSGDAWNEWTPSSGATRRPSVQRMERDLDALLPLPAVPYDACDKQSGRVSSLSLVRYRTSDYSVPVAYGHRDVLVRGYVDQVVISCGTEVIARHPRSYERDDFVYDPIHYLPLLDIGSREPWIRPLRYRDGTSPRSSGRCAVCWKPAWDAGASVSMYRCSGCWRLSLLKRCTQPSRAPSIWGLSASTQ